jgi:signal recognition particle subunit SRP19
MDSNNIAVDPGTIQYDEWVEKTKTWRVIYPYYFDKTVSRGDGRKVPAALAVDKPDVEDIKRMLQFLGISFMVELNKKHPSDHFCVGRVRYQLTRDDG